VVVATEAFAALARRVAEANRLPQARIAVVAHPLGGISEEAVLARAERAVEEVIALFTMAGR
jgi:hypothetical protein